MYGACVYVHTLTCEREFIRIKLNEHKHDDTLTDNEWNMSE